MTEPLERDEVVGLLKRLGSEPDEDVLEAARQVHARITAAGMTWDDLLVPDQAADDTDDTDDTGDTDDADDTDDTDDIEDFDDTDDADDADDTDDTDDADDSDDSDDTDDADDSDDTDDTGYEDLKDESAEPAAETAGKNAASLTLIGKLLAKSGISQDLREELEGYKTDIAGGDFREADRRYLQAISERLSKRR